VKWPSQWTLIGAYFFAEKPQRLQPSYEIDGKALSELPVEVPANQWTPLLLDISGIDVQPPPKSASPPQPPHGLSQQLWCDDVLLLNNTNEIIEPKHGNGGRVLEKRLQLPVHLRQVGRVPHQ